MSRVKDLTGEKFGRWTVLRRAGSTSQGQATWRCLCSCGKEKEVRGADLRFGKSVSCDCLRIELITTHGLFANGNREQSSEYKSWASMLNRCVSDEPHLSIYYKERGVVVCRRWQSFENFLTDMGPRPSLNHSIDRIDNDGSYRCGKCKDCYNNGVIICNCRWATAKQQSRNTRSNRLVTYNGETLCLTEWSERTGISYSRLRDRLTRGWSVERALTTPAGKYVRKST
jgi:hypothetical protein